MAFSATYPEIATASVTGPEAVGNKLVYYFTKAIEIRGASAFFGGVPFQGFFKRHPGDISLVILDEHAGHEWRGNLSGTPEGPARGQDSGFERVQRARDDESLRRATGCRFHREALHLPRARGEGKARNGIMPRVARRRPPSVTAHCPDIRMPFEQRGKPLQALGQGH